MTRDWDAATYHRVSSAMDAMAEAVLDRLPLRGDETVLDAGCGTGRVTARLLERLPRGRAVAVDVDPDMVDKARATLPPEVDVRLADLLDLDLDSEVDAVFSTATFHWVPDHDRLFARLFAALRPGGVLVAQCGGAGNIASLLAAADAVAAEPEWATFFGGFSRGSRFETAEATAARLTVAGFTDVRCRLQPNPVVPDEPRDYLATITCGVHVQRLPEDRRDAFVDAVLARLPQPLTADYVRLNMDAKKPG